MADWRSIITNDIPDQPDEPPFNPQRGREKLATSVERALEQIREGKTRVANRIWRTRHDGDFVFGLRLNKHPITVKDGKGKERAEFGVPKGQEETVLNGLAKHIRGSDEFDAQIEAALKAAPGTTSTRSASAGTSTPRKSSLPPRADGLEHRIPASEPQPHKDYELNKAKTFWRSPEQMVADEKQSEQRKATMARNG